MSSENSQEQQQQPISQTRSGFNITIEELDQRVKLYAKEGAGTNEVYFQQLNQNGQCAKVIVNKAEQSVQFNIQDQVVTFMLSELANVLEKVDQELEESQTTQTYIPIETLKKAQLADIESLKTIFSNYLLDPITSESFAAAIGLKLPQQALFLK